MALPRATASVRLLFLLVSPDERPDEHLRTLAALARFLSDPARVEEVVERFAPDVPRDWLRVRE